MQNVKKYRGKIIYIVLIIAVIAGAYMISANWYQFMLIQGDSMLPAYHNMQLVVLNKYDRDYETGDVIAFWCDGLDCVLVKRIAQTMDDGTYYVLGDNVEESVDSRDSRVGLVERKDIIGKVVFSGN